MQGLQRRCSADLAHLDLDLDLDLSPSPSFSSSLSIDIAESSSEKIQRLISEHPVIIFSRSGCCMCHVMKNLLATIGVNPTVIELDDNEIDGLPGITPTPTRHVPTSPTASGHRAPPPPAVFIGGACVGGLESLVALHLSGHLVPKLVQLGVLWV